MFEVLFPLQKKDTPHLDPLPRERYSSSLSCAQRGERVGVRVKYGLRQALQH